mgnify:CR=1 FL=1
MKCCSVAVVNPLHSIVNRHAHTRSVHVPQCNTECQQHSLVGSCDIQAYRTPRRVAKLWSVGVCTQTGGKHDMRTGLLWMHDNGPTATAPCAFPLQTVCNWYEPALPIKRLPTWQPGGYGSSRKLLTACMASLCPTQSFQKHTMRGICPPALPVTIHAWDAVP